MSNRNGDITLALASIAAELHVDVSALPKGIIGVLRAFSAAHYNAGVRDTLVRFTNQRTRLANEPVPSPSAVTPVVGPHGRRRHAGSSSLPPRPRTSPSKRPTPMVPPPHGVQEDDEESSR